MQAGVRAVAKRNLQHFRRRRHFEVERDGKRPHQPVKVFVPNMPPVLTQVRGDAVGAMPGGEQRGAYGIGMIAAPRIADGGDVIDVDAEADGRSHAGSLRLPGFTAGIAASAAGSESGA